MSSETNCGPTSSFKSNLTTKRFTLILDAWDFDQTTFGTTCCWNVFLWDFFLYITLDEGAAMD
jgi:hypothetical protein